MLFTSKRLEQRKQGLKQLSEIVVNIHKTLIIHYSCESFITSNGQTPRITSICIRYVASAQAKSFSIHLEAQFSGKDFRNLNPTEYNELEKKMLKSFYDFVKKHKDYKWVHWNMRDSNFGFEAIGNRYRILGGKPIGIDDDRKYDFPRILGSIYTYGYEENKPFGRLLNLAKRNRISTDGALPGADEAKAFDNKEYLKLHKSTLRKVDVIESLIERVDGNELKVAVGKKKIYGLTMLGVFEIIKNNWVLFAIWSIIVFVIGAAMEPVIQKFFGTA